MKFKIDLNKQKKSVEKAKEFRAELGMNNKGGNNIIDTFCKAIIDSELVETDLTVDMVTDWLTFFNFSNYFSNEIPVEIYQELDYDMLLPWVEKMKKNGKLVAKNGNLAVNERFVTWQKRREAYFKSHVIGKSDDASLNSDKAIREKRYKLIIDKYDEANDIVSFKLRK